MRLQPERFTTRDLPGADQFAAWRDFYAGSFDLRLSDGSAKAPHYLADHTAWNLNGLRMTRACMPGGVTRQWRHFSRPPSDHWLLVVVPAVAGAPLASEPRHIGFRSLTRSFEGVGSDGEVVTLFLPRDEFREAANAFDRAPEKITQSGIGSVVADFLLSLDGSLAAFPHQQVSSLAVAVKALVSALVAPVPDNLAVAEAPLASALVQRASRLTQANIGSAGFGPKDLARLMCVSRSRLYRAFESYGGVSTFIQEVRLKEAHRRLDEAKHPMAINSLAVQLGFADHSTFSRAFRHRFGYSPRDAAGWDRPSSR
ncbi:helix-turn-helix transcriptional regulator [Bosea rubneri]|uniref:Helix-turn-helix transcriptional regulator n=1 Tax=Bosea rubneri TaxID=3075434 RepID=A0ABU3SHT5_9HYPH|nr:helix-turn-helix transcriptional regulator [Bosea sp. ZW T0_25]MDU0343950.1 helix-turn-helix transcriptional regulator [Bosea sp. ZW T0_25]